MPQSHLPNGKRSIPGISCSISNPVLSKARKQFFESLNCATEQSMCLLSLGHARTWCGEIGKLITFEHNHLIEVTRQCAGSCQSTYPGTDHDRLLTNVRSFSCNATIH